MEFDPNAFIISRPPRHFDSLHPSLLAFLEPMKKNTKHPGSPSIISLTATNESASPVAQGRAHAEHRPVTFSTQVIQQLDSEDAEEGNHLFSQFSKIFHRLKRFSVATAFAAKGPEASKNEKNASDSVLSSRSPPPIPGSSSIASSRLTVEPRHSTIGAQSYDSSAPSYLASLRRQSQSQSQSQQRGPRVKHYEALPMAKALSAALVAPAFASRRDEHGNPCVPVVFSLLKIKVLPTPLEQLPGSELSEPREGFSRATSFTLEIEYGQHVKWMVVRKTMDFIKLHYVLMFRHFQKSLPKLPPFPSQIGYFLDLALTSGSAGRRPERASRRLQQSNARRQSLEDYLAQVCHAAHMHPCKELCEFLEMSQLGLSLAAESAVRQPRQPASDASQGDDLTVSSGLSTFHKDKEGYLRVRQVENEDPLIRSRGYCRWLFWFFSLFRGSPAWKSGWTIVGPSYIALVDTLFQSSPSDVFIVDAYTKIMDSTTEPSSDKRMLPRFYDSFKVSNGTRVLELRAPNELQHTIWHEAIRKMIEKSNWHQIIPTESTDHICYMDLPCVPSAFSLPREMPCSDIRFYADAENYFGELFSCLDAARYSIYITGWWVSPELYLQRPPYKHPASRLDRLLAHKASQGVQVYIIVYKEISMAVTIDSSYTKAALQGAHPNIRVQRHPDHTPGGVLYWAQHEKLVVVDQTVAFIGGLDLCYGRYDTSDHLLVDQAAQVKGTEREAKAHEEASSPSPSSSSSSSSSPSSVLPVSSDVPDHGIFSDEPSSPSSVPCSSGNHDASSATSGAVALDDETHARHDESVMMAASVLEAASYTQSHPSHPDNSSKELTGSHPAQVPLMSMQSNTLTGDGVIWPGLDYSNPRIRDFRNVRQFETALVDRAAVPRMPWHDVHVGLMGGEVVQDLVHHFVTKWNNIKLEKSMHRSDKIPFLLPMQVDYKTEKKRFIDRIRKDVLKKSREQESQPASCHPIYVHSGAHGQQSKLSIMGMEPVPTNENHSTMTASSAQDLHGSDDGHDRHQTVSQPDGSLTPNAAHRVLSPNSSSHNDDQQMHPQQQNDTSVDMDMKELEEHGAGSVDNDDRSRSRCVIQAIRSSSFWSNGLPRERSIHEAYLKSIHESQSFIYIENQFFISRSHDPHEGGRLSNSSSGSLAPANVQNLIAWALYERILRSHQLGLKFRVYITVPLFPAFESDVYLSRASSVRMLMEAQLSTIRRGPFSLYSLLEKQGVPIDDYITILSLRTHGKLNDKWVTEQIYIHSKMMIVDDRVMIVGSANLNDRSMLGDRDAELCVLITSPEEEATQENAIKSFRKRLFREHLGLLSASAAEEERLLDDPCSDEFYHGVVRERAIANTHIYRELFHCVPDNQISTWEDYKEFLAPITAESPLVTGEALSKVKGNFVLYPIHFLNKEDLVASILSPEFLLPAEVYY